MSCKRVLVNPLGRCAAFSIKKHLRRLASSSSSSSDTGALDSFHLNPMGQSDVPMRSRVQYLSSEMTEAKQMGVRGFSCYGFRLIDGSFLYGPVALFPRSALSWRVHTPDEISSDALSLFTLLQPKIDILVLGVGDKKNIDKEDAIATFNWLNAEGRYVGAALYPPDDLIVSDEEYGRALSLIKNWDIMEENPLLLGLSGNYGGDEDELVKKLWGGDMSWREIKEKLIEEPKRREEELKLRKEQSLEVPERFYEESEPERVDKESGRSRSLPDSVKEKEPK